MTEHQKRVKEQIEKIWSYWYLHKDQLLDHFKRELRSLPEAFNIDPQILENAYFSIVTQAFIRGYATMMLELGVDEEKHRKILETPFQLVSPWRVDFLAPVIHLVFKSPKEVADKQSDELSVHLRGLILTATDMESALEDALEHANNRLITGGHTESMLAFNLGRVKAAKDSGKVVAFRYTAVLDARTCNLCAQTNGLILLPDSPFFDELAPPRHPNCRCYLEPLTELPENFIEPDYSKIKKSLLWPARQNVYKTLWEMET